MSLVWVVYLEYCFTHEMTVILRLVLKMLFAVAVFEFVKLVLRFSLTQKKKGKKERADGKGGKGVVHLSVCKILVIKFMMTIED